MAKAGNKGMRPWVPWREGDLERYREPLQDGKIAAQHSGLFRLDGSRYERPGAVDPEWWAGAREAHGRVFFTIRDFWADMARLAATSSYARLFDPEPPEAPLIEVFAVGIELERAALEALSPAATPPGRKRGKKPSPVWEEIFGHFDPIARKRRYRSLYQAANAVEDWLTNNNKGLTRSAIERGIKKYRPDWIAA